jgi:lysyl-tRNA synthetase class 2
MSDEPQSSDGTASGVLAPPAQTSDGLAAGLSGDDLYELNSSERRAKMERLRANGVEPYPHLSMRRPRTQIAELLAAHDPAGLEEGEHARFVYRIAGRLIARRGHAKTSFLDIRDQTGQIQVVARLDSLGQSTYDSVMDLDIGDIVSVEGNVYITKRGQLTLAVSDFTMLAKAHARRQ